MVRRLPRSFSWLAVPPLMLGTMGCVSSGSEFAAEDRPGEDGLPGIPAFEDRAAERGLDRALEAGAELDWGSGGRIAVADLDGDEDLDLVFGQYTEPPLVYLNDGDGGFVEVDSLLPRRPEGFLVALTLLDFDADGAPDLIYSDRSRLFACLGLGDGGFAPAKLLYSLPEPNKLEIASIAAGDVDGDGLSDLLLATSGYRFDAEDQPLALPGAPDVLLLGSRDEPDVLELVANEPGSATLVGTLTDLDGDGDLDAYLPQDRGLAGLLWRQDPQGTFTEVSVEAGADVALSAMGFDSADLDGDGRLDYCLSDLGAPVCLLSSEGALRAGSAALGITGTEVGWGLALADLDNDGQLDLLQASGPGDIGQDYGETGPQPDALWEGLPDGSFRRRGAELGFDSSENHLGLVTADFDGDGSLDVVVAGPGLRPLYWVNRPTPAAFLEVTLAGPAGAPEGFGAQVSVRSDRRSWVREITSSRGPGQGPPNAHFGLGSDPGPLTVEVRWPDGAVTTTPATAGSRLRIPHPG